MKTPITAFVLFIGSMSVAADPVPSELLGSWYSLRSTQDFMRYPKGFKETSRGPAHPLARGLRFSKIGNRYFLETSLGPHAEYFFPDIVLFPAGEVFRGLYTAPSTKRQIEVLTLRRKGAQFVLITFMGELWLEENAQTFAKPTTDPSPGTWLAETGNLNAADPHFWNCPCKCEKKEQSSPP